MGPAGNSTSVTLGTFSASGQVVYLTAPPNVQYFIATQSQSGNPLQITSMMTNSDQGIFATWSTPGTSAYCSEQIVYLAGASETLIGCVPATPGQSGVMTIGSSGIASQTTSADSYGPVLQDANGIFYGSTNEGSLSAFDQTGDVKWSNPGYVPVMLTSDGSVLAKSPSGTYVSFDQNGVTTDQAANLPLLSWKSAYQLGSDEAIVGGLVIPATTFAAVLGGNFTGNGSPVVQHSIGLFWCGSSFNGTCQTLTDANNLKEADLGFTYVPANSPQSPANDFTSNNTWTGLIMKKATNALSAAFKGIPIVTPSNPSPLAVSYHGSPDHVVNIVGDPQPPPGEGGATLKPCGLAGSNCTFNSVVYYAAIMNGAQGTTASLYSPTYPPVTNQQKTNFQNLLVAIGIGLGNTAAHELGHQLELKDMDCNGGGGCTPAPADLYYEDFTLDPPFFRLIGDPLRWTVNDLQSLNTQLLKK